MPAPPCRLHRGQALLPLVGFNLKFTLWEPGLPAMQATPSKKATTAAKPPPSLATHTPQL